MKKESFKEREENEGKWSLEKRENEKRAKEGTVD